MKILLVGSQGKMAKLLCKTADKNKTDQIVAGVDIQNNSKNTPINQNPILPYLSHKKHKTIWSVKEKADIIIDFSTMKDKGEIIDYALLHKIPLAIFSTTCSGSDIKRLKDASKYIPLLVCPNTSIGVNAMLDALDILSNQLNNSDIALTEYHHKNKIDTPSGTAKIMLDVISKNSKNHVQINTLRVGDECGYHSVSFFMQGEKVTLSHTATSKEIFAIGALNMARKLLLKQNGFFTKL